jgi:hypothetical protein
MRDNLEIMREIVLRIRSDEEFAAGIYADCPRLQHQLEKRPDLRPIFEDPNLVRINFEQVYREAGGKLPEDEEEEEASKRKGGFRAVLSKIVNHPLFKVLRFLLLVKKIVGCITGGGVSMVRGFFTNLCCNTDALAIDHDLDGVDEIDAAEAKNAETKAALNKVALHMEDPDVQAQMQELLEGSDPDALAEAVDQDPELSALRDSNPLCAELMKDPETMRILVDPDNLRALGDCPELIEQDFADPNWSPPDDLEAFGGSHVDANMVEVDLDADADAPEAEVDADGQEPEAEGEEEGEGGEEEEDGNLLEDYEMGDNEGGNDNNAAKGGGGRGNQNRNRNKNQQGGFMASVGAGFTDLVAQQVVGFGMSDLIGGDDVLAGLEDVDDGGAADAADAAEQANSGAEQVGTNATAAAAALEGADGLLNDSFGDQLDTLEKGMDDLEGHVEGMDDLNNGASNASATASGGSSAAAVGVAAAEGAVLGTYFVGGGPNQGVRGGNKSRGAHDQQSQGDIVVEAEAEPEPATTKKTGGRLGWVGNLGSAIATAAKESIAGAVLGDDLAEMLVEKQEEKAEERREKNQRSQSSLQSSKSDFLNQSTTSVSLGGNQGSSKSDLNRSQGSLRR